MIFNWAWCVVAGGLTLGRVPEDWVCKFGDSSEMSKL